MHEIKPKNYISPFSFSESLLQHPFLDFNFFFLFFNKEAYDTFLIMVSIGEVAEIRKAEECYIEWKIDDFLLLLKTDEASYYSPLFSFKGKSWQLMIEKSKKTHDCVILYLIRKFPGPPICLEFILAIKTSTEEKYQERHCVKLFYSYDSLFSYRLMSEFESVRRKAELLFSGTIKVVCALKRLESIEKSSKFYF